MDWVSSMRMFDMFHLWCYEDLNLNARLVYCNSVISFWFVLHTSRASQQCTIGATSEWVSPHPGSTQHMIEVKGGPIRQKCGPGVEGLQAVFPHVRKFLHFEEIPPRQHWTFFQYCFSDWGENFAHFLLFEFRLESTILFKKSYIVCKHWLQVHTFAGWVPSLHDWRCFMYSSTFIPSIIQDYRYSSIHESTFNSGTGLFNSGTRVFNSGTGIFQLQNKMLNSGPQ